MNHPFSTATPLLNTQLSARTPPQQQQPTTPQSPIPPLNTIPNLKSNPNTRRPIRPNINSLSAIMSKNVSSLVGNVINDPAGEQVHNDQVSYQTTCSPLSSTAIHLGEPSIHSNSNSSLFYPTPCAFFSYLQNRFTHHSNFDGFDSANLNEYGGVSRSEIWRMLANRIYFSKFYKFIYVSMTILALITIVMSFVNECPTRTFLILECIVNLTLIIEVVIRFFATRRQFWTSKANILDVVLVILCLSLLGMLLHDAQNCKLGAGGPVDEEQRAEALLDSILLMFRNGLQLARIFNMLRKNQNQLNTSVASVDFTALEDGQNTDPFLLDSDQ